MLLAAAAAALGAPFAAAPAWSQAWDMYQGYTESRVIPYANTLPYHELVSGRHALEVAAHLGSSAAATKFTVDTGSTGIAVSAGLLPDFDAGGVMGWVYYDSSSLLAVGHFTTTEVHYLDGDGNVVATATVPVLGVTRKYCLADAKCQHMVSGDGGGGGGDAGIAMMGVGVNRNSMGVVSETGPLAQYLPETGGYLDSAQAAPVIAALRTAPPISQAYNPLVNINGMGETMRRGYIIGPSGVEVGLTSSNTAGFAFQNLAPAPPGSYAGVTGGAGNWLSATMSVTASAGGASGSAPGDFLPDTGLNNGYLYMPGVTLPHSKDEAGHTVYASGVTVTLRLLGGAPDTYYTFTIGGDSPYAPTSLGVGLPPKGRTDRAFLNSGLHFYGAFSYLYDAEGGFVGYSPGPLFDSRYAGFAQVLAASGELALDAPLTVFAPTFLIDQATIRTSSTAVFDGGLTGPGGLTVAGGGAVTLNGVSTHAGGVNVASGLLVLNGALPGAVNVARGAAFVNNGAYVTHGAAFTNAGTFVNAGTVTGDLTNAGSAVNMAGGVIDGSVHNSGSLKNNGTITGQVINEGELSGEGAVGALVARSGSRVSPGNSVGVIRVSGDAALEPGSVHVVEVGPDGVADLLEVGGRASIGGIIIQTEALSGFTPALGASYPILIAAGGVSGAYAALEGELFPLAEFPFLATTLSYGANVVSLDIVRSGVPYAAAALTPNQAAVAAALERLPASAAAQQAASRLSFQTAPPAFQALSGSVYASAIGVMQAQSGYVREIVNGRLRSASAGGAATEGAPPPSAMAAALWGAAYGGWGGASRAAGGVSADRTIGGFMAGVDAAPAGGWRIGFAGGYGRSTLKERHGAASGDIDNYTAAVYGGGDFGQASLRFGAAYTWHDLSVGRVVTFPGLSSVAGASVDAATAQAFGEAGYRVALGGVEVEPHVGLAHVNVSTRAFRETFSPAALQGGGDSHASTYATLGVRLSGGMALGPGRLTARATLAWRHAFGAVDPAARLAFAGAGAPFVVTGAPVARDAAVVGARLDYAATEALTLSLAYDGQLSRDARENAVRAAFSWRF